ncbi:hypothetical protein H696_02716 [Fonticula alba]|uniref:Uncharacterized protein n=1 Tax=Fonticula alba TaxID=691883 RepID=A0A058Z8D5_FONAL|nr:hypothetical protein H696_02716 [Fonticula alba]KCV70381.1 hypothetical protein H696_02716 [Fonticula alba]|eukprot:XP_009494897.1 hypothetical protein H696_02716 [Fonticula alba]
MGAPDSYPHGQQPGDAPPPYYSDAPNQPYPPAGQPYPPAGQPYPPSSPSAYPPVYPPQQHDIEEQIVQQQITIMMMAIEQRHVFLRKVYLTLFAQMALTAGIGSLFYLIEGLNSFVDENYWIIYVFLGVAIVSLIVLHFVSRVRIVNLVFLFIFTVCMGIFVGYISTFYDIITVFQALIALTTIFLTLTMFTLQTRIEFGILYPILACLSALLICFVFMFIFMPYTNGTHVAVCVIMVIILCIYLVIDTKLVQERLSDHNEWVLGAILLYSDLVMLFLYLLALFRK